MQCSTGFHIAWRGTVMRIRAPRGVPAYPANIYTTDAIVDPYPHYTRLREKGPVVWLSRHRLYALPRYTECKSVLRDDKTFISGSGVALNPSPIASPAGPRSPVTAPNTINGASWSRTGCCPAP